MLAAQTAIVRATEIDSGSEPVWNLPWHAVRVAVEPGVIATNEIKSRPMLSTGLSKIYTPFPLNNFRWHERQAIRAETLSRSEKCVVAKMSHEVRFIEMSVVGASGRIALQQAPGCNAESLESVGRHVSKAAMVIAARPIARHAKD